VLQSFEHEFSKSILRYRFSLDTSNATVQETLDQFVEQMVPMLRDSDRLRMQTMA